MNKSCTGIIPRKWWPPGDQTLLKNQIKENFKHNDLLLIPSAAWILKGYNSSFKKILIFIRSTASRDISNLNFFYFNISLLLIYSNKCN